MAFWKKGSEEDNPAAEDNAGNNEPEEPKGAEQGWMLTSPKSVGPDELVSERFGKIRSALGPGTVIQGKLSFDTPVRIDGKLSGEIFSSRALIVGQTGRIDAQVQVASLIIMGSVNGNIKATDRIEVWKGGVLSGEVSTPILVVQEGSWFNGACAMPAARSAHTPA